MKIVNGTITEATSQTYCQHEAFDRISQIHKELDQRGPWPEHITTWLLEHHKVELQSIHNAKKGIDHACLHQDATRLNRVLAEYMAAWLEGLDVWRKELYEKTCKGGQLNGPQ